jgi:hypothetical protein
LGGIATRKQQYSNTFDVAAGTFLPPSGGKYWGVLRTALAGLLANTLSFTAL